MFSCSYLIQFNMDEEFATGDSGASKTFPITAGAVKKNSYVVLKGFPCKVSVWWCPKLAFHAISPLPLSAVR